MIQLTDETRAERQVERFVSRFEPSYFLLACHVALPLVLTPELVNYIRVQFLKSEGVPWIAEADLLLSDLCRPVGYELYVMDEAVRAYLLHKLEHDQRFGEVRIKEIAHLLLSYVKHLAKTNPFLGMKELETQKWGAMLYLDTEQTVKEIARAISECVDKAELARLLKITEDFKQQIAKSGQFQEFLDYAKISNDLLRKPQEVNQQALKPSYQVAEDTELTIPAIAIEGELQEFEVNVATIEIEETVSVEIPLHRFEPETVFVDKRGEIIPREPCVASYFEQELGEGVEPLKMIYIPPGEFWMGAPKDEKDSNDDERPQHKVKVAAFYMSQTPITQAQWRAVANLPQEGKKLELNPSEFEGDNLPVEQVSWHDAIEFSARLSRYTQANYRLPSEAEWEYACRAVTSDQSSAKSENLTLAEWNEKYCQPFHFGETITSDLANYYGTSTYADEPEGENRKKTTPVGNFYPNAFGLYDMHGNVWEWCADPWHDNYQGAPDDGRVWDEENKNDNRYHNILENLETLLQSSSRRVVRGGSWDYIVNACRSAYRTDIIPDRRDFNYGLRVVGV